ncbi:hypothetical protein CCHR01_04947 [Colletotrichum chrysophilum]|uniref:HNH nuclease domain-containing protein n=1 Tax=Colletotrichum chrysophilum TaxID=1836956 RepID=A0AAD9AQ72_9PEZI|nr:hypothetical protein CCHR01_04947 [Colletotrichum chrysophilum]
MFAFFKQYLRSRPAPTSSILGATGRYDFLDDDLSIRRDIIQDIHRLLQANTALLKKENRGDVAKPGDNSRPVMFNSRDVINQARFCAALWSLERLRLDAIHRSLSANEDGFPGDLMESLGMVHEFVWWCQQSSRRCKCCITGRDNAERCYIIPSWTLMRPERTGCLILNICGLFGTEAMDHLRRLVRDRINAANNIIYLSRELQKLWDQGVFALEPLGYDSRPKEREAGASVEHLEKEDLRHCLELRFHWLPKTSVQNLRETASPDLLNTSPRDLIQEFETNEGPQADIGRCINSGEIITIWADRRKDLPAIEFLRARWLACLIHRFSGSADPKVYEPLFPNSDDICATCSMLRDAAELPKLRERLADLELRVKNRMADV